MSRASGSERRWAAVAAGVVAFGIGCGLGAWWERRTLGQQFAGVGHNLGAFGSLHGDEYRVRADDGEELFVEVDDCDDSDGPVVTVIFSHGYSLNHHCWHFQRQHLRNRARLVFVDQRGHGESTRGVDGSHTIDQLGRDLGCVVDFVRDRWAGPVVLIGHSMGGMTVMAAAAERPDLFAAEGPVAGVGLLGTAAGGLGKAAFGLPAGVSKVFLALAPSALATLARYPRLVDRSRQSGSDLGYWLVVRYSFGSEVDTTFIEFTSRMINATHLDVIADFLPGLEAHDKRDALDAMAGLPALVMVGTVDRMTPPQFSREILTHLPEADAYFLPDTGHMLMLERSDVVNQAIDDLLAAVTPAEPAAQ